jgi:hypothetical protein
MGAQTIIPYWMEYLCSDSSEEEKGAGVLDNPTSHLLQTFHQFSWPLTPFYNLPNVHHCMAPPCPPKNTGDFYNYNLPSAPHFMPSAGVKKGKKR